MERESVKNQRATADDLPEYDNPPVTEVVCGVLFKTLKSFRVPYFGVFWEQCKADYPTCQDVAPLLPLIEEFREEPVEGQFQMQDIPLPRVWFISREETGLIQVQRDRFLHNWKRVRPSDSYPRYRTVIHLFKQQFQRFETFVQENSVGNIEALQYEMTYVNHIPMGEGWNDLSELGKVFRSYRCEGDKRQFLPLAEGINLRTSFALPDEKGRLHASIRNGKRTEDSKPVLSLELTVRGFPGDGARAAMWEWFDVAHVWIVRGFTDLTTEEIQKTIWRRSR